MTVTDERVKLYDATGREFVADAEDVDRRLAEGFLRERPAASDRTAPVVVPDDGDWPAGNASTAEWRDAVVEHGLATEEQVAEMGRDELRDKYGPKA